VESVLAHIGTHIMLMNLLHEVRKLLTSLRARSRKGATPRIRATVLLAAEVFTLLVYLALAVSVAQAIIDSARVSGDTHRTASPERVAVVAQEITSGA